MVRAHPRLIVLGGPDGGRSILLDSLPVTIGRSGKCEVRLLEPSVSRRHLRLEAEDEGVVLEVLSSAGVRIGGQKYRKGKRLLPATGDVVCLGVETEILFVAAEDDPGAALAEAHAVRAAAIAARKAEAEASEPAALPPGEPAGDEPSPDEPPDETADRESAPLTPAEAEALERKQRTRRILIGVGIYLIVLTVGAILLATWTGSTEDPADDGPPELTREQMLRILKRPVLDEAPNSQEAARALDQARQLFDSRRFNPGDAYRCIRQYHRYMALADRPRLPEAKDQTQYETALAELIERLWPAYQAAVLEARQGRWHEARARFDRVRELVPLENDPINRNAQRHLKRILDRIRRTQRGPRRGPF